MRIARAVLIILIGSGLLCQCGKKREEVAKERYFQATDLIRQKKIPEAVEVLREVRDQYPSSEWADKATRDLVFYEDAVQLEQYAKQLVVKSDFTQIARACELYRARYNQYPESIMTLMPEYVKKVMKDPWGRNYWYISESRGRQFYILACFGADQIPGGNGNDMDIVLESGKFTVGGALGNTEVGKATGEG